MSRPAGLKKRDGIFYTWLFLTAALLIAGAILLAVSLLPYSTLKAYGDALSKDGSLESLTPRRFAQFHLPVLALSIGLFLSGAGMALRGEWARAALRRLLALIRQGWIRLKESTPVLLKDIRCALPSRRDGLILALLVIFAAFLRLALINVGMEYDESYTFSEFARHSFRQVITDYHVPNNHVFHTILVHFSYLVFGDHAWAIRIPAFLAGLALVPAVYFLARKAYPEPVGWAATGGVAVFPVLVFYSVNARGYSLICLGTLLLLLLSDYVRRKRNAAAWALMVVVTALGFYTIPIMLYPFGIAVTWLFLSGLFGDISAGYHGMRSWLAHLVGFGLCAALLTILLYLPIFQANGILTVFKGNTVVNPLPTPVFLSQLPFQLDKAADEWRVGRLPGFVLPLLLVGSVVSLLLHRRISAQRVPVQGAALLFLLPLVILQRPIILARVWLFLLILAILWSAAGLLGLLELIRWSPSRQGFVRGGAAALALLVFLWGGAAFIRPYLQQPKLSLNDPQVVSRYFKEKLRQGDVVVVTNDEDAQYWYYFNEYGIPEAYIRTIKARPFKHAYIISHPNSRWTVQDTISKFGPDLGFFRMETLKPVTQIRDTIIYEIWPDQAEVDRAYGVKP